MSEQADIEARLSAGDPQYVFRLFVTGASLNSVRAITNIKRICNAHIPDNYKLEIIDVHQQETLAQIEQLVALPLLIRKLPLPERRLIGDLSDTEKVIASLGLPHFKP